MFTNSSWNDYGYHDRNGFPEILSSSTADLSTFPSVVDSWDYSIQDIIASQGHVADFYGGGYTASRDDVPSGRSFDSLADFMGTSQDSLSVQFGGNTNGASAFSIILSALRCI